jgi:hypothetical protein
MTLYNEPAAVHTVRDHYNLARADTVRVKGLVAERACYNYSLSQLVFRFLG